MPFFIPFLIIVGAGLAGAGIGAGIGIAVDAIIKVLKSKRLAVLGERVTGKTVLINFLTKGTLSKEYIQTTEPEKTEANDFKLEDLELKIMESVDVPGNDDFYPDWEDIAKKADIVLYLLRTHKLMEGDKRTEERVKRDIRQIGRWLKKKSQKYSLFIIGTHCDLLTPDLTKLPKNKIGDYEDKLRGMPILQEIALHGGGGRKVRFLFGSLKSKDTTERLVSRLIDQVVNNNE